MSGGRVGLDNTSLVNTSTQIVALLHFTVLLSASPTVEIVYFPFPLGFKSGKCEE